MIIKFKLKKLLRTQSVSLITKRFNHEWAPRSSIFKRITKGIHKGWTVQSLPENVNNFHMNPLVRVLRVIGGASLIVTYGRIALPFEVTNDIYYTSFFISMLFLIYSLSINVIRLIHIIKVLKSDKLDVRN